MVNAGTPCDDGSTVRRATAFLAAAVLLGGCSGGTGRELSPYYDPQGYFRADLPTANEITVTPPQTGAPGPGLLTGVIASPPQPSPSPSSALGTGALLATQPETDQTTYEAFAFSTKSFSDLDEMALYFLTGDGAADVTVEQPMRVAGSPGRLIVADVSRNGSVSASVAAALTLGSDGTGYLLAAIFPPGTWDSERADFLQILSSFRPSTPPEMKTYPLFGGTGATGATGATA
jgi:hypothetical protein